MITRRLAFIAPSAYLLGGVQVWLDCLVDYLLHTGSWEVDVVLVSGLYHDHIKYQVSYPNLPITPLFNLTGSAEGRRRAICSYLLAKNPDLVVGVNIVDLYPSVCRARSKGFLGKVVQTLHAIDFDLLADINMYSSSIDAVIATNNLSCSLVENYSRISPSRVFYAPYGVNPFSNHINKDSSSLRIAWVGRLEQSQKRVRDIVGILCSLENLDVSVNLTIVGDGPEALSLEAELEPWIRSGVVVMLGPLSSSELARNVYATHHVLLITSSWETGPIVAWEAMAAGMAVVSSSYVGSGLEKALIHDQTALLFPVGDLDQAAHHLARLQDTSLLQRLSHAGKELVDHRYTIQTSCKAWIDSFEAVLQLPELDYTSPEDPIPPAGRLDRLFGVQVAESLRTWLGFRFQHLSPGGEWPHTANSGSDEPASLALARVLDRHA